MIRIAVLGQPYWGTRIAQTLDTQAEDMHATFVDQESYLRLLARPPRGDHVVLMRAGYRVGGTTPRGRLFDAYWSALRRAVPRSTGFHYWLGSDVMDTITEARAGTLRLAAVAAARDDIHVADGPWLIPELAEVGFAAQDVHVPQPHLCPDVPPPLPSAFRVMTYLPGDRFEFYGGKIVLEAARRLPDVAFDIVGRTGPTPREATRNVAWHGWVSGMSAMYGRATVVVRIPQHDGLGATVVEGLLHARHVIYPYRVPFVRKIEPVTVTALFNQLKGLRDAHASGTLGLNLDGRAYALTAYDEQHLAERLAVLIRSRL